MLLDLWQSMKLKFRRFYLIAIFSLLVTPFSAQASVLDIKISPAQIFDVQWNIQGTTLNASNFTRPFYSVNQDGTSCNFCQMTQPQVQSVFDNNQYFAFFQSTTNPGTYGLAIFNQDNTLYWTLHNTGSFRTLSSDVVFYNGNGSWGTLITLAAGYNYGESASFENITNNPTNDDLTTFTPASTQPLAAGQTAGASNSTPIANAGPDQTVASAATVTLNASASSDPNDDPLTYAWTQTSGTTVTLSDATAAQPTFTAPSLIVGDANITLVFSLIVNDGTVNSTADTVTITVLAPSPTPATEFGENASLIRQVLIDETERSLRNSVWTNQSMMQSARARFIRDAQRNAACGGDAQTSEDGPAINFESNLCTEGSVTRNDIPFDIDGIFRLSGLTLSTNGTFFGQQGSADGTYRRLFFGDFNVQYDGNTGSNTATLAARVAWEQMTSDRTMLGYFIGAELADSEIKGGFVGDQTRVAVTVGGYAVHQLDEQLYLDGFLTLGAGRNDLEMANNVLALTSDYTTRTATIGAALSGVYPTFPK